MKSGIHEGSCLCGDVRFEFRGEPAELLHCHCRMCQKAHGAVFATFVRVPHSAFTFTAGHDRIATYRSSPEACRTFCSRCGSALQFIRDGRDTFGLAVSTIDGPIESLPIRVFHAESRIDWLIRSVSG